jgi:hypothetical protein
MQHSVCKQWTLKQYNQRKRFNLKFGCVSHIQEIRNASKMLSEKHEEGENLKDVGIAFRKFERILKGL